jgi:hypothetical protein
LTLLLLLQLLAGLLSSMAGAVLQVPLTLKQQCSGHPRVRNLFSPLFSTARMLRAVTTVVQRNACALVQPALLQRSMSSALELLQQLQHCAALLPAADADGAESRSSSNELTALIGVQSQQAELVYLVCTMAAQQQLDSAAAAQLTHLFLDKATQKLLLQPLAAYTLLLHRHHGEQRQQQQ